MYKHKHLSFEIQSIMVIKAHASKRNIFQISINYIIICRYFIILKYRNDFFLSLGYIEKIQFSN